MKECSDRRKKQIGRIGLNTIFKMIFSDNFVHGDMHPGNIIVKENKDEKPCLGLIDAGLVISLKAVDQLNFYDLFKAIVTNNGYEVGQLLVQRSKYPEKVICPETFANEIDRLISGVHSDGLSLRKVQVGQLIGRLLVLCYQHQVKLESAFISITVAMGVVEGLGRQLDPDVDLIKIVKPFIIHSVIKPPSSFT